MISPNPFLPPEQKAKVPALIIVCPFVQGARDEQRLTFSETFAGVINKGDVSLEFPSVMVP